MSLTTGADTMQRLIALSEFAGAVEVGASYVLVDDVSTMGGTLADLANYIQENGGRVAGSVLLVNASRSGKVIPAPKSLALLERRFGLSDYVRKALTSKSNRPI